MLVAVTVENASLQGACLIQCYASKKYRRRRCNGNENPAEKREQQANARSSLHAKHDRDLPQVQIDQRPMLQWLNVMNDRQREDKGSS